ncbi:hypothetical protein RJ641_015489 [Dillenia turbinata]|uniref:Uncharacterized protein n=1 Tax=Dillenia turbinata TaxID=194707 RepID=A0AAN8UPQ7_9MAGN
MVVSLGPGKFYGSALPRPRFYTDVQLNDERVDPPTSVLDPLLQWATEAHWSMGGLSFKRHRLQGRIEGNVKKLRAERERIENEKINTSSPLQEKKGSNPVSPLPAPIAVKRRRYVAASLDDEENGDFDDGVRRKLKDDFDRAATEKEVREPVTAFGRRLAKVASKTRSERLGNGNGNEDANKGKELKGKKKRKTNDKEKDATPVLRTSPRLAKRG